MNSKSLLVAIAALALTATSAQAFSSNALVTAGLTEEQQAAFAVARELREEGDVTGARDILVEAGIDAKTLDKVRSAMHKERDSRRAAVKAALEADDFTAFTVAISGTPLAEVITSEEDFQSFRQAHELRESGDKAGAKEIFTELGLPSGKNMSGRHGHHDTPQFLDQLTDIQKAAFAVARQANDRDAMEAILDEAGIVKPTKGEGVHRLRDGRVLD
jgi:protein-disulfide isomerase-like protein with CxxC motif